MTDLNTEQHNTTDNAWVEHNSLYQAVSDVLECHWDPLGQSDSELLYNRYNNYVSILYNVALKSNCKDQLISFLNILTRDVYGIYTNDHNNERAGQIILAVRDFYFTNVILLGEKDTTSFSFYK